MADELASMNTMVTVDTVGGGADPAAVGITKRMEVMIKDLLEYYLRKTRYRADVCSNLTHDLAEKIKERAKELLQDSGPAGSTYRMAVQVFIGQDSEQSVQLATRCLCNKITDRCAAACYRNNTLFAIAVVCGFLTD